MDDIKLQEESNQFVPVGHLSFYPSEMKRGVQNVEAHFLVSRELEEIMLHSTERATAARKVEADVLLTFQIISHLGSSIFRDRLLRICSRHRNCKFDPSWRSGSGRRASFKNTLFHYLAFSPCFPLFFPFTTCPYLIGW